MVYAAARVTGVTGFPALKEPLKTTTKTIKPSATTSQNSATTPPATRSPASWAKPPPTMPKET